MIMTSVHYCIVCNTPWRQQRGTKKQETETLKMQKPKTTKMITQSSNA